MVPRTKTSLLTALPVNVYAVVAVSCCRLLWAVPLHLDLKAVLVCKACWVEWLHNRHGQWDVTTTQLLTISASLTACRIFIYFIYLFWFSCTFSITIITSSMIMMSGRFWFIVALMTGRAVNSLSVIFPLKKKVLAGVRKRLLYVAWMDKVWCRLGVFHSFS